MDDNGRFPGLMKLDGEGGIPKAFVMLGEEKSSISSLNSIPVRFPVTPEPNLKFRKLSLKLKTNPFHIRLNTNYEFQKFNV